MSVSNLALPWTWLGALSTIPLFWLLILGWILGLFVAIGVFSKRRNPRQIKPHHQRSAPGKNLDRRHKSHIRALIARLAVFTIVLPVRGMTIFLIPPTTSSPGQGHGPGNGGNGGGTSGRQYGESSHTLASSA